MQRRQPDADHPGDVEARAAALIAAYDAQGDHRTGTAVDRASARWLAAEIAAIGPAPRLEHFAFRRLDPRECSLVADGRQLWGVPAFDRGLTPPEGIAGRLGRLGTQCDIAVEHVLLKGADGKSAGSAVEHGPHRALVRLMKGSRPGLVLANAPQAAAPGGVPVLQISGEHADWLLALADTGAEARLTVAGQRRASRSANVVAQIAGRDPALPPLVISTPRSGWWACAGERGGGLVCLLECLRALQSAAPRRTCLFVGFAGHELGLIGGKDFLGRRPALRTNRATWLHFGANLGTPGKPLHLQGSRSPLIAAARARLVAAGTAAGEDRLGGKARGEAALPIEAGIACVAPISESDLFHHPGDRWPEAVDTAALARIARAFAGLAMDLAETGPTDLDVAAGEAAAVEGQG